MCLECAVEKKCIRVLQSDEEEKMKGGGGGPPGGACICVYSKTRQRKKNLSKVR